MFYWQSSSSWSRGFRLSLGVFNPTNRGCTRGDSCSYCHCDHPLAALNRRVRKRTRDKITRRLKDLLVPPVDLETFLLLRFKTFGFLGPWFFCVLLLKKSHFQERHTIPRNKNERYFLSQFHTCSYPLHWKLGETGSRKRFMNSYNLKLPTTYLDEQWSRTTCKTLTLTVFFRLSKHNCSRQEILLLGVLKDCFGEIRPAGTLH